MFFLKLVMKHFRKCSWKLNMINGVEEEEKHKYLFDWSQHKTFVWAFVKNCFSCGNSFKGETTIPNNTPNLRPQEKMHWLPPGHNSQDKLQTVMSWLPSCHDPISSSPAMCLPRELSHPGMAHFMAHALLSSFVDIFRLYFLFGFRQFISQDFSPDCVCHDCHWLFFPGSHACRTLMTFVAVAWLLLLSWKSWTSFVCREYYECHD